MNVDTVFAKLEQYHDSGYCPMKQILDIINTADWRDDEKPAISEIIKFAEVVEIPEEPDDPAYGVEYDRGSWLANAIMMFILCNRTDPAYRPIEWKDAWEKLKLNQPVITFIRA